MENVGNCYSGTDLGTKKVYRRHLGDIWERKKIRNSFRERKKVIKHNFRACDFKCY